MQRKTLTLSADFDELGRRCTPLPEREREMIPNLQKVASGHLAVKLLLAAPGAGQTLIGFVLTLQVPVLEFHVHGLIIVCASSRFSHFAHSHHLSARGSFTAPDIPWGGHTTVSQAPGSFLAGAAANEAAANVCG